MTEFRVLLAGSRDTGKKPVVVPIVVVAIAVHVPLVVPAVERQVAMCKAPSIPPSLEIFSGLNRI